LSRDSLVHHSALCGTGRVSSCAGADGSHMLVIAPLPIIYMYKSPRLSKRSHARGYLDA
jgi:hypothetical protein